MPGAPFQRNAIAEKAFHVSWDQFHRDARALAWRSMPSRWGGPFVDTFITGVSQDTWIYSLGASA